MKLEIEIKPTNKHDHDQPWITRIGMGDDVHHDTRGDAARHLAQEIESLTDQIHLTPASEPTYTPPAASIDLVKFKRPEWWTSETATLPTVWWSIYYDGNHVGHAVYDVGNPDLGWVVSIWATNLGDVRASGVTRISAVKAAMAQMSAACTPLGTFRPPDSTTARRVANTEPARPGLHPGVTVFDKYGDLLDYCLTGNGWVPSCA